MATVPQVPALDLSTLTNGVTIKIDGKTHEIKHPESLPLVSYKRLEMQSSRLGHLMTKADPTKADEDEIAKLLRHVIDAILDAPDAVRAKLTDVQRILIIDVFTKLRPATPATKTEAPKGRRRTGGKSSRR